MYRHHLRKALNENVIIFQFHKKVIFGVFISDTSKWHWNWHHSLYKLFFWGGG